jgi:dihydrofolate reductase
MDRNRVIGVDGTLPWHLPADLKRFRELTMGHPMIMGRKTYQAIGRALPGRTSIVITRQPGFQAPGCTVVESLAQAFAAAGQSPGAGEICVIGGEEIFRQTMDRADRLYVTEIDVAVPRGDAQFPDIDRRRWEAEDVLVNEPDEKNAYRYTYVTYARRAV